MQNARLEEVHRDSRAGWLAARYEDVRGLTERLCEPLETEDYVVQSMPDASPAKWHLAHTSWFFETFVLRQALDGYESPDPLYEYLFNSYYNAVGERHPRPKRGLLSRPTVADVYRYRAQVDECMKELLARPHDERVAALAPVITLGLHHEQQHQELILTDIQHALAENPLRPVYREHRATPHRDAHALEWLPFPEGMAWIGYGGDGFAYDNEGPRHREFLEGFLMASRLVTNAEYMAFIDDGGYRRPSFWLSAGWNAAQESGWTAPLYWEERDGRWWRFSLSGMRPVEPSDPVCHVSYFEADAYARWAGARLPSEAEWERAADELPVEGHFVENEVLRPFASSVQQHALSQMYGDVWEWTRSPYTPYPGYAADEGALGEYNGKFMCNQYVLRGGSCATSESHIRPTYRNFFPPEARWQFTGLRLARDIS